MNAQFSRSLRQYVYTLIAITLFAVHSVSFAQGISSPLFTNHAVDPGPVVHVGTPAAPIPIDLDPVGPPWNKSIDDPNDFVVGIQKLDIIESIINVGTEAWADWHEILLPPPAGLTPTTWENVIGLSVNGNTIGFTATGLGTQFLTLDGFSQPVLPGEILGIHKQVLVDGNIDAMGGPLIRMQEYPTPEPGTLALVAICGLAVVRSRWRRRVA
jgi:hypothetical protein